MQSLKINTMLTELIYYNDCNITHTFSNSVVSFSVRLKHIKEGTLFQISDCGDREIASYDNIESATAAIVRLLK